MNFKQILEMHLYSSNIQRQFLYIFKHNYGEFCLLSQYSPIIAFHPNEQLKVPSLGLGC